MNKFQNLIGGSTDSVKSNRTTLLAKSTMNAANQNINKIENQINEVEMDIERITDVAPENTYDLRPGGKNFSPNKWVSDITVFKLKLYKLYIELEIAKNIRDEWFSEVKG